MAVCCVLGILYKGCKSKFPMRIIAKQRETDDFAIVTQISLISGYGMDIFFQGLDLVRQRLRRQNHLILYQSILLWRGTTDDPSRFLKLTDQCSLLLCLDGLSPLNRRKLMHLSSSSNALPDSIGFNAQLPLWVKTCLHVFTWNASSGQKCAVIIFF